MSTWAWLAAGTGAFIAVSLLVALAVGRILGQVSKDVTDLIEAEAWSAAPLTRALEAPEDAPVKAEEESLRLAE